jgi:hypothetical protein
MTIPTSSILDVLAAHNTRPLEEDMTDIELPEIGKIGDNETVYSTSIGEVFGRGDEPASEGGILDTDDPCLRGWWAEIERMIDSQRDLSRTGHQGRPARQEPPEPHCAWYCPIHFFGHGWGIYIRESCILPLATDIATFVDWLSVLASRWEIHRHLLRSAFYVLFLHEQFHHKVESLGFRLLISTRVDRYRPYKTNVHRRTFLSSDCIEESCKRRRENPSGLKRPGCPVAPE